MAGLFETVTLDNPTFVLDSEHWAIQSANSANASANSAALAATSATSASESALQATNAANSVLNIETNVNTVKVQVEAMKDEVSTNTNTTIENTNIVVDLASQVATDRDTVAVQAQQVAINANNAENYAASAEQSVSDAKDQVTLATNQAILAQQAVDEANNIKDDVNIGVNKAKDWAVKMDGKVDDEDYSAKYWAAQAQNAAAGGVTSFNGRAGIVSPAAGDYTPAMVGAVPTSLTINGKALTQDITLTAEDIGVSDDVYTKEQVDTIIADYAKLSDVYTKTNTYSKTEVDSKTSTLAPIASPALTGTPTAPTATRTTATTQLATTAFVASQRASSAEAKAATSSTIFSTPAGVREFMEQYGVTATFNSAISNLDLAVRGQFFTWDESTTNTPEASSYGRGWSVASDANNITQFAVVNGTGNCYTRFNNAGTWGSWIPVGGSANSATIFASTSNPGGTSFPSTVFTKVPFYSPTQNVGNGMGTDTFTAPVDGLYYFNFEVRFDGSSTSLTTGRDYMLTFSDSTPVGGIAGKSLGSTVGASGRTVVKLDAVIRLTAGSKQSCFIWHNQSGNITVNWAALTVTKIGNI